VEIQQMTLVKLTYYQVFLYRDPKERLLFQRDLKNVIVGQNISAKYSTARNFLAGEALRVYNFNSPEHVNKKKNNLILTIQSLTAHIIPQGALAIQT
jgi:hypothetical protein